MVNWSLHLLCLYFHLITASNDIYLQTSMKARIDLIDTDSAEYYTCRNRCNAKAVYLRQLLCSCLDTCIIYKNCCHDIATKCPFVVKRGRERFGHMVDLQVECLELGNLLAIASCPGESNSTKLLLYKDSLVDIIANAPIKDAITGLIYANLDIYNCNVPTGSRNMIKLETRLRVDEVSSNKIISKFKHHSFYSPFYSLSYIPNSFDPCISESFQWCNQSERTICHTRILWTSHEHIQCTRSPCKFCRLSRFTLCVDEPYAMFSDQPSVMISLNHDLLLSATQRPWSKAKCHVSKDVTLSTLDCHFIKCSTYIGYYLHQDGSCRRFSLFHIALPIDDWTIDPEESGDILNYVTYYLTRVLDMETISSVEPMVFLHNVEVNQSFSLSTLFLDFQSSATEDFLLLTYTRELSILASDVRALVALNRGRKEFQNLSLVWQQWLDTVKPNTTLPSQLSYRWCRYNFLSTNDFNTRMKSSFVNTSETAIVFCLCRLFYTYFYTNDNVTEDCLYFQYCEFECRYSYQSMLSLSGTESVTKGSLRYVLIEILIIIFLFEIVSGEVLMDLIHQDERSRDKY